MGWCCRVVNIGCTNWSTLHNKNADLSLNSLLMLCISSCVIWCKFITNNIINYIIKTLSLHIGCKKKAQFLREMEFVFIQPWCCMFCRAELRHPWPFRVGSRSLLWSCDRYRLSPCVLYIRQWWCSHLTLLKSLTPLISLISKSHTWYHTHHLLGQHNPFEMTPDLWCFWAVP